MADDPIAAAAKALGIDEEQLRGLQRQKDREELKSVLREVLDELLGEGEDDDGGDGGKGKSDDDDGGDGGKGKGDDDDQPQAEVKSLAARLGLTGS